MRHLKKYLLDRLSNEVFLDIDDELQRFYELSITQYLKQKCTSQKKYVYTRDNQIPFLSRKPPKEIMTRSRRNIYLRNSNQEKRVFYVNQKQYCLSLISASKKIYKYISKT